MNGEDEVAPEMITRQSVTHWRAEKMTDATWALLIEAARRAPSSWNHQPARYIVIDDDEQRAKVCRGLHRVNRWAARAPALLVQVARPSDDDIVSGQPYYLYDCGLAMMSLVFQAQRLGIYSRMMIGFDEDDIRNVTQIPADYRIVVMAGLGYLSDSKLAEKMQHVRRRVSGQHKRYSAKDIVSRQVWGGAWS